MRVWKGRTFARRGPVHINLPQHREHVKKNAKSLRSKLTPAQKEAIYALPLQEQFLTVYVHPESGHPVLQHRLVDTSANDYPQVRIVAEAYAAETPCTINPVIVANEPVGRAKIFPGILARANPDLTTKEYGYIDVKSPLNKSNIVRNANDACKQGAIAVVTDLMLVNEEITGEEIEKFTKRIFSEQNIDHCKHHNYTPTEIHWFIKGYLIKCNKPEKN